MPRLNIPFGDFLPSQPEFNNPGCIIAQNCQPLAGEAYGPYPSATTSEITVPGTVLSSAQFYNADGASLTAGGTNNSLFVVSETGTVSVDHDPINNLAAEGVWQFQQFNNQIIAVGPNNSPKYLSNLANSTRWVDLPGDPPNMLTIGRVSEFVVLGNLQSNPSQIAWSSFNNPIGPWSPDRITQAGNAILPPDFGPVQNITGGRYALIFQERAIHRITYVGPSTTWQIDPISEQRGLIAPQSLVEVGYLAYFLAQDGFFVTNGSEFFPIGNDRINQWFFDTVDQSLLSSVYGTIDFQNRSVIWSFKTQNGPFNQCLIYSWLYDKWSTLDHTFLSPVTTTLPARSLDDEPLANMSLDNFNTSLDSPEFEAINLTTAVWREDGNNSRLFYMNGPPLEAMWETGEFEPAPAQNVFVDEVYPVIDNPAWNAEASLVMQDNRGRENALPYVPAGISGFCPVRGEGRRVRIRVRQPSSFWNEAQGIQVNYQVAGTR